MVRGVAAAARVAVTEGATDGAAIGGADNLGLGEGAGAALVLVASCASRSDLPCCAAAGLRGLVSGASAGTTDNPLTGAILGPAGVVEEAGSGSTLSEVGRGESSTCFAGPVAGTGPAATGVAAGPGRVGLVASPDSGCRPAMGDAEALTNSTLSSMSRSHEAARPYRKKIMLFSVGR